MVRYKNMSTLTNEIGKEFLHVGLELRVGKEWQFEGFVKPEHLGVPELKHKFKSGPSF